jgi:transposase
MIQITPQMRILLAVDPVDFRKEIDGFAAIVRTLDLDPFNGYLFVFRSRSGMSLRILAYDSQGFWLCQKRLSKGRFRWWPKADGRIHPLVAHELQALIWNKDPGKAPLWRPLK